MNMNKKILGTLSCGYGHEAQLRSSLKMRPLALYLELRWILVKDITRPYHSYRLKTFESKLLDYLLQLLEGSLAQIRQEKTSWLQKNVPKVPCPFCGKYMTILLPRTDPIAKYESKPRP